MASFTDEMFNRIVEFQERLHPAWNERAPFDERIRGLPLHALIFSNPDRNPATHAHTVAPFYPLRAELQQIATLARQVADDPVICDVHARNGFLGSLLGREGVRVIGLRDPVDKPNQIEQFLDPDAMEIVPGSLDGLRRPVDVVLSAWMPAGINRTADIVSLRPRLIIFIHTEHTDRDGNPQTGTWAAYHELPAHYRQVAEWTVERPADLLHEVWPDLTRSIAETRIVRVYADAPWQGIPVDREVEAAEPYDWERDLDMALTALEAKEALRARGFSV